MRFEFIPILFLSHCFLIQFSSYMNLRHSMCIKYRVTYEYLSHLIYSYNLLICFLETLLANYRVSDATAILSVETAI